MITWLTDFDFWINDYASGKSSGSASGSLLGHNNDVESVADFFKQIGIIKVGPNYVLPSL